MCAVFVETHGLGGSSVNLRAPTFDLCFPCGGGVCVGLPVKTANELEGDPRTLLWR